MSNQPTDKALQEFLSEAQEIVDALNRDVLALDEGRWTGAVDPEVVNNAFRQVHSLKGLSGLFGVARMTHLAHRLENLLDGLRLGRIDLEQDTFDLLFEAVELFQRIIAETAKGSHDQSQGPRIDRLVERLDHISQRRAGNKVGQASEAVAAPASEEFTYEIDPAVRSVLTEYEEHRLKENIKAGHVIGRVHAAFDLMTIDQELEAIKRKLKPFGEVITYLPAAEAANENTIEIDVLVGLTVGLDEVRAALEGSSATVLEMPVTVNRIAPPPSVKPAPAPSEPPPPIVEDDSATSIKSVAQTVRVDIRKLDNLMNVVGELAITRAGLQHIYDEVRADHRFGHLSRELHHEMRTLTRKLDELQQGILEVRMVPLSQMLDKLSRVVRKISRDAGKDIRLNISGGDTELDKLIVEELSDPLMHIIRNSIDHGIETEDRRQAAGKPRIGTISIHAQQRGNHVVLTIEDDGAGINDAGLVKKAIARGVLDEESARDLTRRDRLNLMFLPGVSTKEVADHMSGRGVGMDVVKTNIARLSGIIDIDSEPGKGTRLIITLPVTLAIIKALIIRVAGRTFAVPLNAVLESLRLSPSEITTIERREMMELRGQMLPLVRLGQLFRLSAPPSELPARKPFVVVVGLAQHRLGVLVDELIGQQDIVIKSLGRSLADLPGIAGATELGGQKTVLVLDVGSIVEEAIAVKVDAA